jgi:hypothetical protein
MADMDECNECWEVYTRLSRMPNDLILKLLNEAGKDLKESVMMPNKKEEIKTELIELSKSVKVIGFNKKCPASIWNLTRKLAAQIKLGNKTRIKMYLAFCIKVWPLIEDCPIDRRIMKQAVKALA